MIYLSYLSLQVDAFLVDLVISNYLTNCGLISVSERICSEFRTSKIC